MELRLISRTEARGAQRHDLLTALVATLLLVSIPISTALGALLLAAVNERRADLIDKKNRGRITAALEAAEIARARPEIARLIGRMTMSEVVERLARALPADARLHALSRERDGGLVMEVDVIDPDGLRPALASDPLFAGLREIGQQSAAGNGLRVTLRTEGP